MSQPDVSCIIAVYNGERYLAEAIDSLIAQTCAPIEIIVVDDGSTDGSAAVARGYGQRVRLVSQPNRGVSAARNHGVALAQGELICFLDADDHLHARKVERQLARFANDSSLDLCNCLTEYFWSPELTEAQKQADPRYAEPFWHKHLVGHISTWLVRRRAFDAIGGFKVGQPYAEDVDWYTRLRDGGGRMTTVEEVLSYRRLHTTNVTLRHRNQQMGDLAGMLRAHLLRKRTQHQGA